MPKVRVLNKERVRPIPVVGNGMVDKRPIKGFNVCPELYANIFITARKNSGKTTIIYHLLKSCATKDTTVIIFSSTVFKDKGMINIRAHMKKAGIPCVAYNSLDDDGVNRIQMLVDQLQKEAEDNEQSDDDAEPEQRNDFPIYFKNTDDDNSDDDDDKPKKRKSKYQSPPYIVVLDDLSNELRSPALIKLLKENRHFGIKTIISSQYVLDLLPAQRAQIDLWIVPKGQTLEKLETIYKDSQCTLDFADFLKYYKIATADTKQSHHNFLFFMPHVDDFRINFDRKLIQ
jgi:hypothetical protein